MNELIKEFYAKAYPTDDMVDDMDNSITFQQLLNELIKGNGDNIYEIMGVDDSLIRERVFLRLSEIMNIEYEYIYNLWLHSWKNFYKNTLTKYKSYVMINLEK